MSLPWSRVYNISLLSKYTVERCLKEKEKMKKDLGVLLISLSCTGGICKNLWAGLGFYLQIACLNHKSKKDSGRATQLIRLLMPTERTLRSF